ncbi:TonB-dependent receptor [Sphingomonas profundi]|uniref:TonB-dependent receptor n=1 Tax=Alterirhizorhabdus profundi TaxID=2681549 RepID=UPI001E4DF510|nr:TonB-dependent receptor [Sphingomonas profundi]
MAIRHMGLMYALGGASLLTIAAAANAQTPTASDTTVPPAPAEATAPPPATPGAAAEDNSGGLADIIVTAQKRSENLQNVPISVTAVSGAAVSSLHAATLQGLQGTVPNIQINNFSNTPNTAAITIRGIGVIEPDPYAGNTVSIVYDGVPQYFSMGALVDLYDISRIEVLRGPQGTLFGANTTGGVVNIVTEQPTGELGGKVEASYGNYKRFDIAGTLDVPLVKDVLAGKLVVSHNERDGWVRNIVDGSDLGSRNVTIYRGYLKLTPSPNFDATLIGEYDRARNGAPVVVAGDVPGDAQYIPAGTVFPNAIEPMYQSPCLPAGRPCNAPDKYRSASDGVPDTSNMDTYRATLTMNLRDTPIGDITSITGYKHFRVFEFTDQDGTPKFQDDTRRLTRGRQFSQELRSAADITDSLRVIYGAFFLDTHYTHQQDFRIQFAAPGLFQRNNQDQDNYSISGFVQSYYDVTDKLRLQAGVRYTYEQTKMLVSTATSINLSGMTDFDATGNVPISTVAPPRGKKSWNNVGWKLGVDYKVIDGTLLYGSWARGFKSGGFTGRIGLPADALPYDPEHVDTFEAGIKTDLLDRHLRLNLAGFYTNYRDIQIATIYFTTDAAGTFVQGNRIINAAKAEIKGFEFEATALPFEGLTLNGSLAYLDAKYKKFDFFDSNTAGGNMAQTRSLKGFALQNAPKWSATAGFTYEADVGPGKAAFHLAYSYVSSKFLTAVNDTPRSKIQPTHLVDGNIDWTPTDSFWSIGVWGRNLLDNRYIASVFDAPGTLGLVNYAPPREYGVTAKVHF